MTATGNMIDLYGKRAGFRCPPVKKRTSTARQYGKYNRLSGEAYSISAISAKPRIKLWHSDVFATPQKIRSSPFKTASAN